MVKVVCGSLGLKIALYHTLMQFGGIFANVPKIHQQLLIFIFYISYYLEKFAGCKTSNHRQKLYVEKFFQKLFDWDRRLSFNRMFELGYLGLMVDGVRI